MYASKPGDQADEPLRRREYAERLLDLADHLPPADRSLLRGVYDRGMTASELARVLGQRPRGVRRRMHRLIETVTSPAFIFVLRSRLNWPEQRRRVGELFFLHGRTQRATAAKLGLSVHRVRQEIDRIRMLMEHQAAPKAGEAPEKAIDELTDDSSFFPRTDR